MDPLESTSPRSPLWGLFLGHVPALCILVRSMQFIVRLLSSAFARATMPSSPTIMPEKEIDAELTIHPWDHLKMFLKTKKYLQFITFIMHLCKIDPLPQVPSINNQITQIKDHFLRVGLFLPIRGHFFSTQFTLLELWSEHQNEL